MPDREKVIKGLECCINTDWEGCEDCPYYDNCKKLTHDALALLKAQEPRVMTWLEIVDAASSMPFIWLECKDNPNRVFQSILFKTWLWDSMVTIITVMTQGWLFEGHQVDYGKIWRCWTSPPTDAQMEGTPWQT